MERPAERMRRVRCMGTSRMRGLSGGAALLECRGPFDLSVGFGKEISNQRIELVFFEDRHGMARVGYDP